MFGHVIEASYVLLAHFKGVFSVELFEFAELDFISYRKYECFLVSDGKPCKLLDIDGPGIRKKVAI